ncbi:LysM peptidoglycan-binding domain-containing protein [Hansschlegelia beijingensis]|uniref:LysM peptidoglycan-binding domain-containing protein n=1 Tax=Hansschlegelia beijingensis TaxID=1133344 RepID=UPI00387EEC3A
MTPPALAPGDYQLALRTRGADGSERVSEQTVTVSVPQPPSRDVVVVLNDPNAPSRILQKPAPAAAASAEPATHGPQSSPAAAPSRLSIGAVDAESGRFFVQGAAPEGANLRIYLNDALVAQAVSGKDSRWSLRVERGLSPGDYTIRVDRVEDAAGKVAERAEARFTYEAQSAAAEEKPQPDRTSASAAPQPAVSAPSTSGEGDGPSEPNPASRAAGSSSATRSEPVAADAANPVIASLETVKVRRGDSLWRISRTAYGHGRRYTLIFEANDGQIRNPHLIYPDQVFVLPSEPFSPSAAR